MFNTYKCNYCKEKTDQYNEIILDGTNDVYVLEVCNKCYELLNDYFPPEDIDEMFSSNLIQNLDFITILKVIKMFYEGCTLNEIRAYRKLEYEIFDFGEGEMKIDGWYGSEDAYYEMSLPEECCDYPEYNILTQKDLEREYKKQKQKLNRYVKKQIDKEKLKKLYNNGGWWTVGNLNTHLYRCYRGSRSKYLKKLSNKKVRKSKGLSGKNNRYRKVFDYWHRLF